MDSPVVRLGAWCDVETEDEARHRLVAGAADADDRPEAHDGGPGARSWGFVPFVPDPEVPVLDPRALSFRVTEFADLADGRRIRLHAERGFTLGVLRSTDPTRGPAVDPWQDLTLPSLEGDVRTTVLPDDAEGTGEDHPWEWLAELLRAQGIAATGEHLRGVPYDVEFSDRLRTRVAGGG